MRGDDDDEEESSLNATRYPCMPSLVALQQMRNRLHLAHLGKKLMKWTALATGRELRRLACEIDETYKNFTEDMRSAFMLIARGRYFYPNLNNIVLENVAQYASITVATSTKSISGVKVLQLEVIEVNFQWHRQTGLAPYEHLGIDKGGQTINEAKMAWLDLLKRLIVMLQQRTSFYQLDQAHKSATKKMNMLAKVVIPRIKSSMKYIVDELEEMAREDLYRLKKVLEVKRRKLKEKKVEEITTCPFCLKAKGEEEVAVAKCILCGALLIPNKLKDVLPAKGKKENEKLEQFKAHIREIIDISKDIEDQGALSESVENFLKTAEILQGKLKNKEDIIGPIPSDIDIEQICEKCKKKYDEELAVKHEAKEAEEEEIESAKYLATPPPNMESIEISFTPPVPDLCEVYSQPPIENDLKLGTFETEIQEITKILRIKNEDGTITEEKKVVKLKRVVKVPVKTQTESNINLGRTVYQSSDDSSPSIRYPGKKTVGMMTIKSKKYFNINQSVCTNAHIDFRRDSSTNTNDLMIDNNSSTTILYTNSDVAIKQKFGCVSNKSSVQGNAYNGSSSEEEFKSILSFISDTFKRDKEVQKNEDCDSY